MELVASLIYWVSAVIIGYVYIGYPLILKVLSGFFRYEVPPGPAEWPSVSLIIAAYNEERVIEEKLKNTLRLDYPREKLEIIVVSDGSTDRTDDIVKRYTAEGVRLLRVEGRQGKTVAQNRAVEEAVGEVVVFSDANAMYRADAIKKLVRHFARDDVGCVEGRRVDYSPEETATAEHELKFRDYESWIKTLESRVLSCTGATGPIYAVRRSLYVPLEPDIISDLIEPMMVMGKHRKRHVYEPSAVSREPVFGEMHREFRRKVRIMTRCLHSLGRVAHVMNPFRTGWFSVQVISHRFLRWLLPMGLLALLCANIVLARRPFYFVTLMAQCGFYGAALVGWALEGRKTGPRIVRLPYYFSAANAASLLAVVNWVAGKSVVTWKTDREESCGASDGEPK
jgi:cellulose synthase/poly-beta-1,6-N-acetylglucosamine synthase-like glycosyltransferase